MNSLRIRIPDIFVRIRIPGSVNWITDPDPSVLGSGTPKMPAKIKFSSKVFFAHPPPQTQARQHRSPKTTCMSLKTVAVAKYLLLIMFFCFEDTLKS
jgi:hypothetical protein